MYFHKICTLLVLNFSILARQNFAGIYFCYLKKKNMKKGHEISRFTSKFLDYLEQTNQKFSTNNVLDFDFSSLDSDLFVYCIIFEWYCFGFLNETERV